MKTVELVRGGKAITVMTKTYVTRSRLISIVTDLIFHDNLSLEAGKRVIMEKVRGHLWYQGTTVYCDWYEDTIDTPVINEIYAKVEEMIDEKFPELKEQEDDC